MKRNETIIGITSLVALASVAYFMVVRMKSRQYKEIPPATAPQLDIQNPGDQSAFPAAPSGEKDLG